jgi:hypothetical protein
MVDEINKISLFRLPFRMLAPAMFLYGILGISAAGQATQISAEPAAPTVSYARLADLVLASPAIAKVNIKSAIVVPADRAPGLPAGMVRFYVQADTLGLIRGETVVARRISFLLDGPAERTKKPGLKGRTLLAFGKGGSQVDQFQLTSSTGLIDWSPANEALVRKVLADALAPDLPPAITAVSSAFHVAGAVLGEGETQIFLDTSSGTPISLSIIRRPDEQPHFSASLGEIVDDSASLPPTGTMLWYRLACGLPERLPARALREVEPADASAATRDYAAFRAALAPCDRSAKAIF